jgi:hypothetical protein
MIATNSNLRMKIFVYVVFYNLVLVIEFTFLVDMSSPSTPPQHNVTFSCLTANGKRVYNRLVVWLVSSVGFSIQERQLMNATQISTESLSTFTSLLDTCDVVLLCQNDFRADIPLPGEIADIKVLLLKEFYSEKIDKVSVLLLVKVFTNVYYFLFYYIISNWGIVAWCELLC